jgi:hypothetical protein
VDRGPLVSPLNNLIKKLMKKVNIHPAVGHPTAAGLPAAAGLRHARAARALPAPSPSPAAAAKD